MEIKLRKSRVAKLFVSKHVILILHILIKLSENLVFSSPTRSSLSFDLKPETVDAPVNNIILKSTEKEKFAMATQPVSAQKLQLQKSFIYQYLSSSLASFLFGW